jgi:hypothetical protein
MGEKRSAFWPLKPSKRARVSGDSLKKSDDGSMKVSKQTITIKTPRGPHIVTILHPELLDGFYDFMVARHKAFERRFAQSNPPLPSSDMTPALSGAKFDDEPPSIYHPSTWTDDAILQKHGFANVYRMLDHGTQFLIQHVINRGPQTRDEIAFRVILYRFFNKPATWELLAHELGEGKLTYAHFRTSQGFAAYEDVLRKARDRKNALYSAAYIIPAPDLGQEQNMENHLRFPRHRSSMLSRLIYFYRLIRLMMETDLPHELAKVKHLRDAYEVIHLYPCMGKFLAFQCVLQSRRVVMGLTLLCKKLGSRWI